MCVHGNVSFTPLEKVWHDPRPTKTDQILYYIESSWKYQGKCSWKCFFDKIYIILWLDILFPMAELLEMFCLICLYYFIGNVHGNTSENAVENVLLIHFILFYSLSYYFQALALGNVLISLFILFYYEYSWKYFRKYPWKCFINSVYIILQLVILFPRVSPWKCFAQSVYIILLQMFIEILEKMPIKIFY